MFSHVNGVLKRKHERISVRLGVALDSGRLSNHAPTIFSTMDISPSGVNVSSKAAPPLGSDVLVRIILPSRKRCTIRGKVWRNTYNGVAIKFDQVSLDIIDEFGYSGYNATRKVAAKEMMLFDH